MLIKFKNRIYYRYRDTMEAYMERLLFHQLAKWKDRKKENH